MIVEAAIVLSILAVAISFVLLIREIRAILVGVGGDREGDPPVPASRWPIGRLRQRYGRRRVALVEGFICLAILAPIGFRLALKVAMAIGIE